MFNSKMMKKALYLAIVLGCVASSVVVQGQNESAQESAAAAATTLEVEGTDVTVVTCEQGVYDCENTKFFDYLEKEQPSNPTCAPYNNHFVNPQDLKWVVGVAAVIGMVMSYGIGSNDAANSWGTSVGSGAISLRWGCFVGGIMEWAGAVAVGYGVAKTIKGTAKITTPDCFACGYCNSGMSLYAIAMLSALTAAAIFLLLASTTWMPVSTTHAIIGGAVGATWAAVGWPCLNWALKGGLGGIVLSWVCSPLLSGIIGSLAYFITNYTIIKPKLGGDPRRNAMIGVPILYGAQAYVMMFLILMKAPLTKKKYTMTQFALFSIPAGVGVGIIGALYCWFYVRPRLPSKNPDFEDTSKKSDKQLAIKAGEQVDQENGSKNDGAGSPKGSSSTGSLEDVNCNIQSPGEMVDTLKTDGKEFDQEYIAGASLSPHANEDDENFNVEETDAIFYFKYLLVFVAALESFAHGSNDTGNATGAVSAIIQTFQEGTNQCSKPETPVWVMAVAGFFVFLGVNTYGYRVIQTIGKSITSIT